MVEFTPVAIALGDGPYPSVVTLSYDATSAVVEMHSGGRNPINARLTVSQLRAIAEAANELADALDPPPAAAPSMRVQGGAS